MWFLSGPRSEQRRVEGLLVFERVSADQWLGTRRGQVVVGELGAGESTLLRYLVLDLLSECPVWRSAAERWGMHLPVWLPLHFFMQRLEGRTGREASSRDALRDRLEQNDSGAVWPLVEEALEDERLLSVVDGLEERVGAFIWVGS